MNIETDTKEPGNQTDTVGTVIIKVSSFQQINSS